MNELGLTFRRAQRADLERVVQLLADDPLGSRRESFSTPLERGYVRAFASIEARGGMQGPSKEGGTRELSSRR